jgi:hypothetical protein
VNREVRSRKDLTEPTLLEMSGNPTNQELAGFAAHIRSAARFHLTVFTGATAAD